MQIIAQQGNRRYLVLTQDDEQRPLGRVLDLDQGKLFPNFNCHSILSRGYWEPYEGPQSILDDLLAEVEDMAPPAAE